MKGKGFRVTAVLMMLLAGLAAGGSYAQEVGPQAAPLGTGFTYQGQLQSGGAPYSGACDLRFGLWDALSGGAQIGTAQTRSNVSLAEGYFTVQLDFGSGAFQGDGRWLAVEVRCPAGAGSYTPLSPRQALTAAPYALYARAAPWSGLVGVPAGFADGVDDDTTYRAGTGLTLSGVQFSVAAGYRLPEGCANGQIAEWDGRAWVCGDDDTGGGSGGGDITAVYAGTGLSGGGDTGAVTLSADATYLQRRVTGTCASGNAIRVVNADGTVTCDPDDDTTYTAGTGLSLVGTTFAADTSYLQRRVTGTCTSGNAIRVVNADGTVTCQAVDANAWSLIGNAGTTPGTQFLGTTDNKALELKVNGARVLRLEPAGGSPNLVGGYAANWLASGVYGATIGGGGEAGSLNRVTDTFGTVGGGWGNQAGDNTGTISDRTSATVGGGYGNTASGHYATVGGGSVNTASGDRATVGGGYGNTANLWGGTIAGGHNNSAGVDATVGGGSSNSAGAGQATVSGGSFNTASGEYASVGGGNTNTASGSHATVAGGYFNTASGNYATVPGGASSLAAGDFSFAAGRRAKANNQGCFVWGDSTAANVACNNNNRWVARASGGVYFYTNASMTTGAYLAAGSGTWASLSDRNLKGSVVAVDPAQVLASLAGVPISTWGYTSEDPLVRHMGPMAQDFYAAFGLGGDDTHITTVDADGVALAAIQGLYAENQALKAQVAELDARLSALEAATGRGRSPEAGPGLPGLWLVGGGLVLGAGSAWAARRRPGGVR
jgi:trimeric autotransporter adhesin